MKKSTVMTSKLNNLRRSPRVAATKATVEREYFVRRVSPRIIAKYTLPRAEAERLDDIQRNNKEGIAWGKSKEVKTLTKQLRNVIDDFASAKSLEQQVAARSKYYSIWLETPTGIRVFASAPAHRAAHGLRINLWHYMMPYNTSLRETKEKFDNVMATISSHPHYVSGEN